MQIEKPIGKYSEEQAKRNLKKAIPIVVISYAFVLLTGLSYLSRVCQTRKMGSNLRFCSWCCLHVWSNSVYRTLLILEKRIEWRKDGHR